MYPSDTSYFAVRFPNADAYKAREGTLKMMQIQSGVPDSTLVVNRFGDSSGPPADGLVHPRPGVGDGAEFQESHRRSVHKGH